jgi:hypothetical protein
VVSDLVFLPTCVLHVTLMILGEGVHVTYRRRRHRGAENIFQSKSKGEEGMGDRYGKPDESARHVLNDLKRAHNDTVRVQSNLEMGQQQMVELLTKLAEYTQGNQTLWVMMV